MSRSELKTQNSRLRTQDFADFLRTVFLFDAAARDAVLTVFPFVVFVVARVATAPERSALSLAARSMMVASMAPASPLLAGRFDVHTAGVSSARMSSKSPSLLTLFGANSVISRSPAQSSRCLISSQLRAPSEPVGGRAPGYRPPVRTRTHEPLSLYPFSVNFKSPFLRAASTSATAGVHVPTSQSRTIPAPYPSGITPSNSP